MRSQGMQPSAQGPGNEADGMNDLHVAVQAIQRALGKLRVGGRGHTQAVNALRQLSRVIGSGEGAPTAGIMQTNLMDLLRGVMRNAMQQRLMANQGGAQQGGPGGTASPQGPHEPMNPMGAFPGA
jgi:hypothetical protein